MKPPTLGELLADESTNRGGGWGSSADERVRPCFCIRAATEDRDHNLGFRTVQSGARMPVGKVNP